MNLQMQELIERINEFLGNRDWSLVDLANNVPEIPYETLRNLMYHKTDDLKSFKTLKPLATALGVTTDYLLGMTIYPEEEFKLLKNYRNCSNHGKQFVQEMAKYEAYYTDFENEQTRERSVVCIEPTGDFRNGILWDSCKISRVTTYLPQIYMAFKIPTHAFLPTYTQGEKLFIEHRLPKIGENAIFYKDNYVYVRNFLYSNETGFFTLKAISMDAEDIVVKSLKDFHIIGTIITPDRATEENKTKKIHEVPLPLEIQELIDKIKEPQ